MSIRRAMARARGPMGTFLPREKTPSDPAAWALDDLPAGDVQAVMATFGETFGGEIAPTVAFLLDRWGQDYPEGLRWRVLEHDDGPIVLGRAPMILDRAFETTRSSLRRKALVEHAGDMETTVRVTLKELMAVMGLALGLRPAEAVQDVVDARLRTAAEDTAR